jgi:hypothetical protein
MRDGAEFDIEAVTWHDDGFILFVLQHNSGELINFTISTSSSTVPSLQERICGERIVEIISAQLDKEVVILHCAQPRRIEYAVTPKETRSIFALDVQSRGDVS